MPDHNPGVNAQYERACRLLGDQIVEAAAKFVSAYRVRTGATPVHLVMLAGTCLAAALASTRPDVLRLWSYNRATGVLHIATVRAQIIVCEMPGLHDWQYRIVAAGAKELGSPGMAGGAVRSVTVRGGATIIDHTDTLL